MYAEQSVAKYRVFIEKKQRVILTLEFIFIIFYTKNLVIKPKRMILAS